MPHSSVVAPECGAHRSPTMSAPQHLTALLTHVYFRLQLNSATNILTENHGSTSSPEQYKITERPFVLVNENIS